MQTLNDLPDEHHYDLNNKPKSILTTSTMRSKLKSLETKDRIKTLVKRSMTDADLKQVQKNIDAMFEDQSMFGFSDFRKIGDHNP